MKTISRCCCPDVLHAIRHAPISLSCSPTRAARHYISSFLLSATQEMNHSNNHPTCAQMTPEHRTDRHTNFNTVTHTHFVFFFCCCCTALCPVILLHHPPSVPSSFLVQQFQIRLSHQFLAGQGEKKEGRKAMKMMISLSPQVGACRMQSTSTFHLISFSI